MRRIVLLGVLSLAGALLVIPTASAVTPTNDVPPTVTGVTQYREVLTASPGGWSPAGVTFAYQWLRDGSAIGGATSSKYRLGLDDVGHVLSVEVTAADGADTAAVESEPTSAVGKATFTNEKRPEITGKARYTRTVTASKGKWSVKPTTVRYQWLRRGKPIAGATDPTYRLKWRDVGKRIKVEVTARRDGYKNSEATSKGVKGKHTVAVRRVATYHVETRGKITANLKQFKRLAQETYDDPRGWRGQGVKFRRVAKGGSFTLVLAQAATVPSFSSACSSTWSCRVGRFVIINQTRWTSASPAWHAYGRSLRDYRHMVVNHETGHWLGRGHLGCPAPGAKAPVMMQQSKGLAGCRANPWPTKSELHTGRGNGRLLATYAVVAE